MDTIFNKKVLYDTKLSPSEKVIYIGLASQQNANHQSTLTDEKLGEMLRKDNQGQLVQLSKKRIDAGINKLIRLGYLNEDRTILLEKEDDLDELAAKILDYVSDARKVRGYSSRKLSGVTHLRPIKARLRDGKTYEECIAVINYRFESTWHKQNNEYLVPSTMFRPTIFNTVLSQVPDVKEWSEYKITEYGVTKTTEEEIVGYM